MTPETQSSYWAILRKQMPFPLSISEKLPVYFLHASIRQFIFCYSVYSWSGWQMVLEPIPMVTGQEAGIPPGQATGPSEPISRRPNAYGLKEETKVENARREQRECATFTYDDWESNPEPAWSDRSIHSTNTTKDSKDSFKGGLWSLLLQWKQSSQKHLVALSAHGSKCSDSQALLIRSRLPLQVLTHFQWRGLQYFKPDYKCCWSCFF